MAKTAREILRNKLQFYHHNCPADTVIKGYEDLEKCTCGIDSSIQDALRELEAMMDGVIGRPHNAWCEPSSNRGCTCHVKHQLERAQTALYGKDTK